MKRDLANLRCNNSMAQREPTALDQLMLELINRARLNPQAEANRLINGQLNEGIATEDRISTIPKQPLAFNLYLNEAAQKHSDWMLNNDIFSHTGANSTTSQQRMANEGYSFIPAWGSGENIAWKGTTGTVNVTQFVIDNYEALFIDEDYPNRGHRLNILKDDFQEVGISSLQGIFTANNTNYNSVMTTQDFAYSNVEGAFLTGVVYTDAVVNDDFYTIGEGIDNIQIIAENINTGSTFRGETYATGGYSLQLPNGTYQISVVGNLDQDPQDDIIYTTVTINEQNVKFDVATDNPDLANTQPTVPPNSGSPEENNDNNSNFTPNLPIIPEPEPNPDFLLQTPFYRFQNQQKTGTYLYANAIESENIRNHYPQFQEEGFAFFVGVSPDDDLIPIYRFHNNNIPGTYLYANEGESQIIRQNYPNFYEEGLAFYVYGANSNQGNSIYRFQNENVPSTYLFVNETERQNILANYPNFTEEGIAFNVEF